MKKIYTLIAGLAIAGSVNAQTQIVKDGGFEGMYIDGTTAQTPSVNFGFIGNQTDGILWSGVFKQTTTSPITATKSISIESVDDQAVADELEFSNSEVGGFASQIYNGNALAGKTKDDITVSFKYKYARTGVDTAFVMIDLMDTTLTGNAQVLYQGLAIMPAVAATATARTISANSWYVSTGAASGTINRVRITLGSSFNNYFEDNAAPLGTVFIVDDMSITVNSSVGVNDIAAATSTVYPNPVADVLNVEIANAEASSIAIYSLDGTLVKSENLNGVKGSVNVEGLTSGMYLYSITTKAGSTIQSKFLKK